MIVHNNVQRITEPNWHAKSNMSFLELAASKDSKKASFVAFSYFCWFLRSLKLAQNRSKPLYTFAAAFIVTSCDSQQSQHKTQNIQFKEPTL